LLGERERPPKTAAIASNETALPRKQLDDSKRRKVKGRGTKAKSEYAHTPCADQGAADRLEDAASDVRVRLSLTTVLQRR